MSLVSLKRPFGLVLFAACALVLAAGSARAQQPQPQQGARFYAVLPFKVNNDKYRYMSPGAQEMMSSRLAWTGYFEPAAAANVARGGSRIPTTLSEAGAVMARIGAEYLVAGDLNFHGDQVTASITVWNRMGQTWSKSAGAVPLDGLVPALNRLAGDVRTEVFKRPGENSAAAQKRQVRQEEASKVAVPANSSFLAGDGGEAPMGPAGGPVMNPQFRYEGGAQTPGRWQSQTLRFAATGMVVGDFVGDKKNRVILVGSNTIYAYEFFRNALRPLAKYDLGPRERILRVSLLDVDHDGTDEIIVSCVDDPDGNAAPRAYIFKYDGGKFAQLMKPVKYYLSVMRLPPSYRLSLVGQRKGFHGPFDESGVSEMMYQNGTLEPMQRLHLPSIANAFNFTFLPDGTTYKIVVLNEYNYLKVFTAHLDPQFSQEEGYNSSNVYILADDRLPGMDMSHQESGTESFYYIPIRMIPAEFGSAGKFQLLMNKDISLAAQIFAKFRRFSQGEVHSMFWDGVGMSLAWKTRRIKGTVVDLGLADLKNVGQKQLVVCLNTYSSAVGMSAEKTIVLTYDLNTPKK